MVDELANPAVKLGNDDVADLVVVLNQELSDQELGISALGKLDVGSLEFSRNLSPLLGCRVLYGGLDGSDGVVLEDKVLDTSGDDGEELVNQGLSFLLWDMRLSSESLPEFLCALEFVGERFGGLALLGQLLLLQVGFTRCLG